VQRFLKWQRLKSYEKFAAMIDPTTNELTWTINGEAYTHAEHAARPHPHLDLDRLAARLARRLVEDDPLSCDGILDRVACVNHLFLLGLLA
jgi:hypothetical protein